MALFPKITFGIIVLNGEPFVRYNLRALYPYAHEIIIVEGAAPAARNVATSEGHSRDRTLEVIRLFMAEEDPGQKVQLITKNGFWNEKDDMSQSYAERATGNYLWQVDVDEFYQQEDMNKLIGMLNADPTISVISFTELAFWGRPTVRVDGWYQREHSVDFIRLFRWRPGYTYFTHRPPTVVDSSGTDLRKGKWVRGRELARKGIYLYHYSLLFPKQVKEKCDYYAHVDWTDFSQAVEWANSSYFQMRHPFRVHNTYKEPSWLEPYKGPVPPEVTRMMDDIKSCTGTTQLQQMTEANILLSSSKYVSTRFLLKIVISIKLFMLSLLRPPYHVLRRIISK